MQNIEKDEKTLRSELFNRILNSCIYNFFIKENKILNTKKLKDSIGNINERLAYYITLNTYLDINSYLFFDKIKTQNIKNQYSSRFFCYLKDLNTLEKIDSTEFTFDVEYSIVSELNSSLLILMKKTNLTFIGDFLEFSMNNSKKKS